MERVMTFGEVLDAADQLSLEEQETLADVLHRRIVEGRRRQLALEVAEARQEYQAGDCQPTTPDELMAEILA